MGGGRGAIAECHCHCNVLWWGEGGEWTWCHCRVPLQGAILECYGGGGVTNFGGVDVVIAGCSVLWWGEEVDAQFCESGRGAIAGCHSSVLWLGG